MSVIREGEDLIMQLRYSAQSVGAFDLLARAARSTGDDAWFFTPSRSIVANRRIQTFLSQSLEIKDSHRLLNIKNNIKMSKMVK